MPGEIFILLPLPTKLSADILVSQTDWVVHSCDFHMQLLAGLNSRPLFEHFFHPSFPSHKDTSIFSLYHHFNWFKYYFDLGSDSTPLKSMGMFFDFNRSGTGNMDVCSFLFVKICLQRYPAKLHLHFLNFLLHNKCATYF